MNRKISNKIKGAIPKEKEIALPSELKPEHIFRDSKLEYKTKSGGVNPSVIVEDVKIGFTGILEIKSKKGTWYKSTELLKSNR